MKYEIQFHPLSKTWKVWRIWNNGAEIVKSFKSEAAARSWIARQ
jgi:hypothetical protein